MLRIPEATVAHFAVVGKRMPYIIKRRVDLRSVSCTRKSTPKKVSKIRCKYLIRNIFSLTHISCLLLSLCIENKIAFWKWATFLPVSVTLCSTVISRQDLPCWHTIFSMPYCLHVLLHHRWGQTFWPDPFTQTSCMVLTTDELTGVVCTRIKNTLM